MTTLQLPYDYPTLSCLWLPYPTLWLPYTYDNPMIYISLRLTWLPNIDGYPGVQLYP